MSTRTVPRILALVLALAGCDTLTIDDVTAPGGGQDGGAVETDPHPYLSCDPTLEAYDPVCELGCGHFTNAEGEGHMLCGIPCDSDADCSFAAGESIPNCLSRCYFQCDGDHPCPEGLECVVDGGGLGECMAPYSETPAEEPPAEEPPTEDPEPPPGPQ